jgi:hypothetical protein
MRMVDAPVFFFLGQNSHYLKYCAGRYIVTKKNTLFSHQRFGVFNKYAVSDSLDHEDSCHVGCAV